MARKGNLNATGRKPLDNNRPCPDCGLTPDQIIFDYTSPKNENHNPSRKRYCILCDKIRRKKYATKRQSQGITLSSNRNYKYGMVEGQYEIILEAQYGVCPICNLPPKEGEKLQVDHNHKTGKIRGLLHLNCNTAIGYLKDSPERARALANYLENTNDF